MKARDFILGLLVILVISSMAYFGFNAQQSSLADRCTGGASYLITDANLQFNNELGKDVVVVQGIANQNAECLRVELSPDTLNKELPDDEQATKEVIFDISLDTAKYNYDYFNNLGRLGEIQTRDFNEDEWDNKGLSCGQEVLDYYYSGAVLIKSAKPAFNIIGRNDICSVAYVNANSRWSFGDISGTAERQIDLDVNYGTSTKTLNSNVRTQKFGDELLIQYEGSLGGDFVFSSPSANYEVAYRGNDVRVITKGTYKDLSDKLDDIKVDDQRLWTDLLVDINNYNTAFKNGLSDKSNEIVFQERAIKNIDVDSGLTLELEGNVDFPVFKMFIDAEKVGIQKLQGEPNIVSSCGDIDIESNDEQKVSFQVKNNADVNAIFSYYLTCDGILQNLDDNVGVYTGDDTITVTGDVNGIAIDKKRTYSCEFIANDRGFGGQDSCKFDLEVTPKTTACNSGESVCIDAKTLATCRNGIFVNEPTCELGCDYEGGKATCRSSSNEVCDNGVDDDNDNYIDQEDPDCQGVCKPYWAVSIPLVGEQTIIPNLSATCLGLNYIIYVSIGISLIIGILIFGLLNKELSNTKRWGFKNKTGSTIVAVIISLIVSFILYTTLSQFWWVLVIILVLFIIIRIVLRV